MKKKEDAVKRNDEKVLRIPLRAGEAPDLLCLGMLAHQTVPGILPVQLLTEGERRTFVTAVGSRVTLRELARTHQPRAVVCGVLTGVLQAFVSAADYMLPASALRMGPEEIWADPETGEACVTAYPVMGMHAPEEPLTDRLFGILRECRPHPLDAKILSCVLIDSQNLRLNRNLLKFHVERCQKIFNAFILGGRPEQDKRVDFGININSILALNVLGVLAAVGAVVIVISVAITY